MSAPCSAVGSNTAYTTSLSLVLNATLAGSSDRLLSLGELLAR